MKDDFLSFVIGANAEKETTEAGDAATTTKHLAGKHNQDRHGVRVGADATPEQLAARRRVAAGRAEQRGTPAKPAKPAKPKPSGDGWKVGSNYISKKSGDVSATIYTRGGQQSDVFIPKKGINTTFRYDDHLGNAKALADAALRGEFDHPIIKTDFDSLVKDYGLKNSYGAMQRGEWERFKLGIATNRAQLKTHAIDRIVDAKKGMGIGDVAIPKSGAFSGVPMRIKGFGGKDMRINPMTGFPYGKASHYIATLFGREGGDRFSQTAWNGLDTGIEIRIPVGDF